MTVTSGNTSQMQQDVNSSYYHTLNFSPLTSNTTYQYQYHLKDAQNNIIDGPYWNIYYCK